ncbi:MAG: phosphoglycerate kinase [Notoacmeibacter sp.]|nr:phosphoglycerate kinase [Notoacmeibacter sp.]
MMAALSMTDAGFVLAGKTVLVRTSFDDAVSDRLATLLAGLADRGARVAVIAGLGNPAGDINPALSLAQFVAPLAAATGKPVTFIGESVGTGAEARLAQVDYGAIALLENLRFNTDERRQASIFAMRLSVLGDFYIDAGDPPTSPNGWQETLKTLLPEPFTAQYEHRTEQEA